MAGWGRRMVGRISAKLAHNPLTWGLTISWNNSGPKAEGKWTVLWPSRVIRHLTASGAKHSDIASVMRWASQATTIMAFLVASMLGPTPTSAQPAPGTLPVMSIPEQASADSVSNFVFRPSGGTTGNALALYSLTVKIGATSGYVMVFNATALPSNGAVTPLWCWPVTSNGTNGSLSAQWTAPIIANASPVGIVAGFSTTGCDSLTASATAKFMGQAL